jgi:drug/metabolite transporter (DMT)-like permease
LIARPTFLFSQNPAGNLFDPSVSARVRAVVSALLGICGSSIAYTTLRWLKDGTDPLIPVTYFTGFGTVGSIICLAMLPSMPGFLLPATGLEWIMAFALSFGGFVMQWTLTRGMQLTKGSIGAQIIAAQLVFAVVLELMVWGDLPTVYSCVGILLIVFSLTVVNIFKAKDPENSRRAGDGCVPEERRGLLQAEEGL